LLEIDTKSSPEYSSLQLCPEDMTEAKTGQMEQSARKKLVKQAWFFLVYLLGVILLTIVIDRLVVSRFCQKQFDDGLIFKPFTQIQFKTIEYEYDVYVNNFGFRDIYGRKKLPYAPVRIMAIGDSFTYGWGVKIEDSWPKVLEKILNEQGLDVEVDDLGKPGAGPEEYAEIAEKAIPVLKPNLVIVGMLQGDDLAQASSKAEPEKAQKSFRQKLAGMLRAIYPYSSSAISCKFSKIIPSEDIHRAWKAQAVQTYRNFSSEQKARFNLLDEEVKRLFVSGELNPAVIYIAITNPDYYLELENLESPKAREKIEEMANCLVRIKSVAEHYQADVMVVSIPHRVYVGSESDFNTPHRFGFNLDPQMLNSDAMDRAIQEACQKAGLEFRGFTPEFRSAAKTQNLFFQLDGHLNQSGHQLLGKMLAELVANSLN